MQIGEFVVFADLHRVNLHSSCSVSSYLHRTADIMTNFVQIIIRTCIKAVGQTKPVFAIIKTSTKTIFIPAE